MTFDDPNDPGNAPEHHTGKPCVLCQKRPAGTAWSPVFCFECNVARINRINKQFENLLGEDQQ